MTENFIRVTKDISPIADEDGLFWVRVDGGSEDVENVKNELKEIKKKSGKPFTYRTDFIVTSSHVEISEIPELDEIVDEVINRIEKEKAKNLKKAIEEEFGND